MFFHNLNHNWTGIHPNEGGIYEGVVLNPSAFDRGSGMRRTLEGQIDAKWYLFDPQLYLLNLPIPAGSCPKFMKHLATYPWIGMTSPDFDSGELRPVVMGEPKKTLEECWRDRKDPMEKWSTTVREAVNYQVELGCDVIILPAPLIIDPATDLERDLALLEEAVGFALPLAQGKPIFASLPLADTLFAHSDFLTVPIIEAIVDNLSTVEGISGVYIPFVQIVTTPPQDKIASENCPGALMRLARRFGTRTELKTIFNFTESLGIACRALGAFGYGSGYNLKQRRLNLADLLQTDGGPGQPKFYSLELCADIRPVPGLERIAEEGLLAPFLPDRTPTGGPLLDALIAGRSVRESAPEWADDPNNLSAARQHYFELHNRSHERVVDPEGALRWLENATVTWDSILKCLKGNPQLDPPANHLAPWRDALKKLLAAEAANSL